MKRYSVTATKRYKKDYRCVLKSGLDVRKLEAVIDILASGAKLDAKYRDHALTGELAGTRECHIGPDWLLLYAKNEGQLVLLLVGTGDHLRVLGIE